jgi:hypothetical protein
VLTFLGYELELFAVGMIGHQDGLSIRFGKDVYGEPWLIVGAEERAERLVWVCAPVTTRMLDEVASGRAHAWDAVSHSVTGMVDVVMVDNGRAVPDRCVRSGDLDLADLRVVDPGLTLAA